MTVTFLFPITNLTQFTSKSCCHAYKVLGLPIRWKDLIVSIICSLLTFPFSVLTTILYREIRPSSVNTIGPMNLIEKTILESTTSIEKSIKSVKTLPKKKKRPSSSQSLEIDIQLQKRPEVNSNRRQSVLNSTNQVRKRSLSFLSDIDKLISENGNKVHSEISSDSGYQKSNPSSSYLKNNTSLPSIQEESTKDFTEFNDYSDISEHSDIQQNYVSYGCLPFFCSYFAFLLLLCVYAVCCFFILLYGQEFGYQKATRWALSFHFSLVFSFIVMEPLKILFCLVFYALRRKQQYQFIPMPKSNDITGYVANIEEKMTASLSSTVKAPQGFALTAAKKTAEYRHRVKKLKNKGFQHLGILFLTIFITYSYVDSTEHRFYQALKDNAHPNIHKIDYNELYPNKQITEWEFDQNKTYALFLDRHILGLVSVTMNSDQPYQIKEVFTSPSTSRPSNGITIIQIMFFFVFLYVVKYVIYVITAINTKKVSKLVYSVCISILLSLSIGLFVSCQVTLENAYKKFDEGDASQFRACFLQICFLKVCLAISITVLLLRKKFLKTYVTACL